MKNNMLFIVALVMLCFGANAQCTFPISSICPGTTVSGGSWNSSNTAVVEVDASTGAIHGVAAGTATLTYTTSLGSITLPITIGAAPSVAAITGTNTVCVSGTIELNNTTTGGTWTSGNSAIAAIASTSGTTATISGIAVGSTDITYTVSNSCGSTSVTIPVTVGNVPSVSSITGSATVCTSATTNLTNTTTGGTWTSENSAIAAVSGTSGTTATISGVAVGSTNISYTVTNSCGSTSVSAPITVGTVPSVGSITGSAAVCTSATTILNNSTTGGTWTSSNSAIADITGTSGTTATISGVAVGSTNISYTVTNSCGSTSVSAPITVGTVPSVGSITGSAAVCTSATTILNNSTTGGTWTSENSAIAAVTGTSGATATISGVAVGSTNISYMVTNGCGSASVSAPITVGTVPSVNAVIGDDVFCKTDMPRTYTCTTGGGVWSLTDGTNQLAITSSGSVSIGSNPSNVFTDATVKYTVTNSCGSTTSTKTIHAKGYGRFTNAGAFCSNGSRPFTVSPSGGNIAYSPASGTLVSGPASASTTSITLTGIAPGSQILTYTAPSNTNYCSSPSTSTSTPGILPYSNVSIAIQNPSLVTFTGPTSIALNEIVTWATNFVYNGTWSSSNTSIASFPDGTGMNTSKRIRGIGTGTATITYTGSTACPVTITRDISVASSRTMNSTNVMAQENTATANIRISPNPNSGRFTVSTPESTSYAVITITDINGRVVATRKTDKQDNEFDLGMRARGMYMVTVETNSKKYSQKIQVE